MLRTLKINNPIKDHPLADLRAAMPGHNAKGRTLFAKYTCEHCHQRVMHNEPNSFPDIVICANCGKPHNFAKSGGNYAAGSLRNPSSDIPDAETAQRLYREGKTEVIEVIIEAGPETFSRRAVASD